MFCLHILRTTIFLYFFYTFSKSSILNGSVLFNFAVSNLSCRNLFLSSSPHRMDWSLSQPFCTYSSPISFTSSFGADTIFPWYFNFADGTVCDFLGNSVFSVSTFLSNIAMNCYLCSFKHEGLVPTFFRNHFGNLYIYQSWPIKSVLSNKSISLCYHVICSRRSDVSFSNLYLFKWFITIWLHSTDPLLRTIWHYMHVFYTVCEYCGISC